MAKKIRVTKVKSEKKASSMKNLHKIRRKTKKK
jgi:hypothetical protein